MINPGTVSVESTHDARAVEGSATADQRGVR
jgi:hypothetical protein